MRELPRENPNTLAQTISVKIIVAKTGRTIHCASKKLLARLLKWLRSREN